MLKVFLADDEYFVRISLKNNIPWNEYDLEIVGEANNGGSAFERICELQPDIGIIDINMPGYTGIELIRMLNEHDVSCRYIILTGYDEFEYARQAIQLNVHDYILKPIDYDALIISVKKLKEDILNKQEQKESSYEYELEQYFNDLINYNLASRNDYYDNSQNATFSPLPQYSFFRIVILRFLASCERKTVKMYLADAPLKCDFLFRDMYRNYYIVCDSSDEKKFLALIQYLDSTFLAEKVSVKIGIGNSYSGMDYLYLSYMEAQIALKNVTLQSNTTILYYSDINNISPLSLLNLETKIRIKIFILEKNIEKLRALILEIYTDFSKEKYSFDSIFLVSVQLINLLIEILSTQSCLPISVHKETEDVLDAFQNSPDIKMIAEKVFLIYKSSIQYINYSTISGNNVSVKIEEYINKNYNNPELTIPMIADNLFLNYSYLCTCFKRDRNVTINDYLNQVRIRHAVEMFDAGVINVKFVAESCGYTTPGYFSKRFRKVMGVSPSEYCKKV